MTEATMYQIISGITKWEEYNCPPRVSDSILAPEAEVVRHVEALRAKEELRLQAESEAGRMPTPIFYEYKKVKVSVLGVWPEGRVGWMDMWPSGRFVVEWEDEDCFDSSSVHTLDSCLRNGELLTDEGWQSVRQLSEAALEVIAPGSDSDFERDYPLREVVDVVEIQHRKTLKNWGEGRRRYAGPQVDVMQLVMADGSCRAFYEFIIGYSEGWARATSFDKKAIFRKAYEEMNWGLPTECLECGAVYSRPGHVDPSGMGCERC